jgi:hypothetical protein
MILYNPTVSGSLAVTGSLTTTGTITSQTLVVQTITSSIEFNTGSTRNGTLSTNTHEFTGSVSITGSAAALLNVNNDVLYVSSSGNIGIGVTSISPISTYKTLEIRGATGGGIKIGKTGFSPLNIQHDGTDAYINNVANGSFNIYTNDTPRLFISSSGNVGIGTSSPQAKLDFGSTNMAQTILLFTTGNFKGGFGTADGEVRNFIWDTAANGFTFGSLSSANGTTFSEKVRISTGGIVTKPFHPVFHVAKSDGNVSAGNTVIWNVVHANVGSYYNNSNGRFTAPVAGVYYFAFSVMSDGNVGMDMSLQKNGVTYQGCSPLQSAIGSSYNQLTGVCTIILAAGDYVTILNGGGPIYSSNANGGRHTMFCGFLIG